MMVLFQGTGGTVTRDGLASNQLTAMGGRLPGAGPRSGALGKPWASVSHLFVSCFLCPSLLPSGAGVGWAGLCLSGLPGKTASCRQIPQRMTFHFYPLQPLLFMILT